MTRLKPTSKTAGLAAAFSLVLLAGSALAQEERGSGNFLDNLFNRGEPSAQSRQSAQPAPSGRAAQSDPGDLSVRLDRMENALRQLTGTIEQLQYRNQQLETQIQQLGARGAGVPQPQASWGNMIRDGREAIQSAWWLTIFPGIALVATVLSVNALADRLRSALTPRQLPG